MSKDMQPTRKGTRSEPHESGPDSAARDEFEEISPEDKRLLAAFKMSVDARTERSDAFWENLQLATRARIHARSPAWRRGPVWLSVAAATITAVLLAIFGLRHQEPPALKSVEINESDLLDGVQRALNQKVPAAFAPGLLLTQEMQKSQK